MAELVVLRGKARSDDLRALADVAHARWLEDRDALLALVEGEPGGVAWVAIASDVEAPAEVVERVRALDPRVGFVLCGSEPGALDVLRDALAGDGEAQRRALEAEKLASIAALTAGITHDVGTPMTAILGYAELLAKSVEDEKNRKRARTIVEQVHRVSELLETLMSLSRTQDRAPIRVDLASILDRALDFYREKLKRHAVEIERLDAPAPQIQGNPARLNQVFLNLVLNAVDAMPKGGTLRVSLGTSEAGEAEVRIADTGTPIDPKLGARVFEPYFSVREHVTERGLGLLVARAIVEEHGGRIELASEAAETQFRLTFPAAN